MLESIVFTIALGITWFKLVNLTTIFIQNKGESYWWHSHVMVIFWGLFYYLTH